MASIFVTQPSLVWAQSPSCDSPQGSGACLPWGTTIIGGLPGEIYGLSADGSVIVGATPDTTQTFRWKLGEGVKLFTVTDSSRSEPPSDRQSISANGGVIVGETLLPLEPNFQNFIFRWDADADTHILLPSGPSTEAIRFIVPTPPSTYVLRPGEDRFFNPEDSPSISADGNTIVGLGSVERIENGTTAGFLRNFAFEWTSSGGTTDAPQVLVTERLTPHSVSGDGLTVIGEALPTVGSEFSIVTISGATQTVVSTFSAPTAVSHDGMNVAGESKVTPFPGYRWTNATGALALTNTLLPRSISDDGNTITSFNRNPGPPFAFSEPWVWDPVNGDRWMQQMIANDFGLNLLAYGTGDPAGIVSGDGHVFTMGGSNSIAKTSPLRSVVMGDSYASGEGVSAVQMGGSEVFEAGTDIDGTNECHRSPFSFSTLMRPRTSAQTFQGFADPTTGQPDFQYDFIACSGALTGNILTTGTGQYPGTADAQPQLSQGVVDSDTDFVVVSIGGNDTMFEEVATACVTLPNCRNRRTHVVSGPTWEQFLPQHIDTTVRAALLGVYQEIKSQAPNASIVALGYPLLLSGVMECPEARGFSVEEQNFTRQLGMLLNQTIRDVADEVGVHFVPVSFTGHEVCTNDPWIRGVRISNNREYSFHPSRVGHQQYAQAVNDFLNNTGISHPQGFFDSGMPKNPPAQVP